MPSQSTNAEPGGQGASGTRRTPAIEQRQLTPDEIRQEIDRVSGAAHSLSTLRSALPVARTRNIKTAETVSADAGVAYDTFSRTIDAGTGGVVSADVAPAAAGAELTPEQRDTVIDQALLMLEDLYAHLPLKRALHAVDPIQRLRLLQLRQRVLDEREFQSEMIDIFVSLRDLHTNYQLPSPYRSQVAYLPIRVEEYYEKDDPEKHRHYLISRVSPRNTNPALSPGLEITHWNGAPIDLAVARNAEREAGSNPEARRGQGLSALTLRWFGASLPARRRLGHADIRGRFRGATGLASHRPSTTGQKRRRRRSGRRRTGRRCDGARRQSRSASTGAQGTLRRPGHPC